MIQKNAPKSNTQTFPRKAIPPQQAPVLVIEKGSPRRSSRKNPSDTNNEDGRGLSSLESPQVKEELRRTRIEAERFRA
jgi:hypothetical protein